MWNPDRAEREIAYPERLPDRHRESNLRGAVSMTVLLAVGVSSAQLLSLILFLIPEKTLDEKFQEVQPPADTLTDAQIESYSRMYA